MTVQWVVKLSKLCNLRCTYCYEYPNLGDPARMRLDQLEALFRHAADHSSAAGRHNEFVWHGGEPLLAPAGYFDKLFDLQQSLFSSSNATFSNSIQTNLYRLKPDSLDLLKRFNRVGVSVDVFGDLRLTAAGKSSQKAVLENMQRLTDEGIRFGCITVLSRSVAQHIEHVFDFFASVGLSFRLLPIYRSAFAGQHEAWSLDRREVEEALIRVFDLMVERGAGITVSPLDDYFANVLRKYAALGLPRRYPTGDRPELLFIVDTDGTVYPSSDAYNPSYAYGNIFDSSLPELLKSEGYERTLQDRRHRLETCDSCEFSACCSGQYIGEATPEQRHATSDGGVACPDAWRLHAHIERWLRESGFVEAELGIIDLERLSPFLPDFESDSLPAPA